MADIATISIDRETVEGIVERQMQAAIVGQLDAVKGVLLERTVEQMLKTKVDLSGRECSYGTPLIEYLAKKKIREMAESALNKFFDAQGPAIEEALLRVLTKEKKMFAKMATQAMTETFKSHFKWNVKIEVGEAKE